MPWLLVKHTQFGMGNAYGKQQLCTQVLHWYASLASDGAAFAEDDLPIITAAGQPIQVSSDLTVDLSSLILLIPCIPAEWALLRDRTKCISLAAWRDDCICKLPDVLDYFYTRSLYSDEVDSEHWLTQFRNAVARVMAFLFEAGVAKRIVDESSHISVASTPDVLYGPSGVRRCRRGVVAKRRWLTKLLQHCGTDNTKMDVLADGHKGYVGTVRSLENYLYLKKAAALQAGASSGSFHWDGASYSGFQVNVALAMNVDTRCATYLKPVVRAHILSQFASLLPRPAPFRHFLNTVSHRPRPPKTCIFKCFGSTASGQGEKSRCGPPLPPKIRI